MGFSALLTLIWVAVVLGVVAFVLKRVGGFLRHMTTLSRTLRDPGGLGRLLSDETRQALREAGKDPDTLRMDADLAPELRQRVTADLFRALDLPLALGASGRVRIALGAPKAGGGEPPRTAGVRRAPDPPTPSPITPLATEPPPYQVGGDPGARLRVLVSAAVIAVAGALYLALR